MPTQHVVIVKELCTSLIAAQRVMRKQLTNLFGLYNERFISRNLFQANVPFLYPLNTSENWFSLIFSGYRYEAMA